MFGIVAPGRDVSRLTYFALYALQHRGQGLAGIATGQHGHIMAMRDQGGDERQCNQRICGY